MRRARPERALESAFARQVTGRAGEGVVVALSGGSDSVALLALCASLAARNGMPVHAVHVHHGLRASADQDAAVALAACSRLGVRFTLVRVAPSGPSEAALRTARYAALAAAARSVGAARVLTGHTAEDQTETVLLALFRGTGHTGLQGMGGRALAADVQLERPLLRRARAELRAYCTRLQLPYVIDPTNVDLNYRRNAVRAALAPLRPAFPGLDLAVARCAAILRRDAQPPGGAAATLLREFLQQEPDTEAVSAERIESIVRFLDIGAGRRLRISLEANPNAKPTSSSRGEHTVTPYDEEA